ncbi:1,2-phenylacetyl-CoA epoxidase subunit PaaD [Chitinophaga japonensis]|uniref:Ring-1,2-phenylacetyl-CoA epoxidase subunit PaaD n=1 Tax=Chitinophaga japonensis TaxID=104662 RepID=A0A562TE47_CHIJA|nr:1,2-phenylacetyl-CoA epoxidase subunit PaaD [Chitinophaga japonensis]TWI91755.1 ring-1,2-phenylacetyl-CoA epoxidase subunit PaaD [Chitinophaga japonensis]
MTADHTIANIYAALEQVMDPEIPVLSVLDLGMITAVTIEDDTAHIKMIPTFAACPAINFIQQRIQEAVAGATGMPVRVTIDKEAHWHSKRLSEAAKEKLRNFGIAPPGIHEGELRAEMLMNTPCPHCGSKNTYLRSPFGATLCRAVHYCKDCGMVFEQFKPVG